MVRSSGDIFDYRDYNRCMRVRRGWIMSKVYDGIMGLVVGDALGVPVEFKSREELDRHPVKGMIGYGTHNQPPGTWSDDSSMTLATLESIGRLGHVDPLDIMDNFMQWYIDGEFAPYGEVFDIGGTTHRALKKYKYGKPALECGGTSIGDNGNGALMRILPLAFVPYNFWDVNNVTKLTHAHVISLRACRLYLKIAKQLLEGININTILAEIALVSKEFIRIRNLGRYGRDMIKSTGYVVDTLEAALWCLIHTYNYKDCVLTAVNLGGDTDTTAAVAGGLAGIIYGCGGKGIPEKWIKKIPRRDWIKELCEAVR